MSIENSLNSFFAVVVGWVAALLVNWLGDQLPSLGQTSSQTTQPSNDVDGSVKPATVNRLSVPRCANCGHPRKGIAYSGMLAWLLSRRNCSQCDHKLAARHPLVEVFLIVAFVYCASVYQPETNGPIFAGYITIFTLIAVIDIEHRLILNVVMLPAFGIALLEVILSGRMVDLREALAGYAIAQIAVMVIYLFGGVYLWLVNRRREEKITEVAFGFGDVTLATLCGLIIGSRATFFMLIMMIFVGASISIAYWMVAQLRRNYKSYTPLAYGPAILIATTALLLWPDFISTLIYGRR